jgi:hypothetical protein
MRRFEPATSRVRRLRASFTIATFPGRNARTVSGYNRRPNALMSADYAPQRGADRPETRRPDRMSIGVAALGACPYILFGQARIQGV